jgi:hypothetical protein
MLTTGERATAHRMAVTISERGDLDNDNARRLLASALLEAEERERGYQVRAAELKDTVERITASGVENATRYAVGIAAERRAGAAAVERIRAALLEGASDAAQAHAIARATWTVQSAASGVRRSPDEVAIAAAYLALSASHAETRALLADISARARELLGKGGT